MPSQEDLQTPTEYFIYEDPDQGGHTKTRNEPSDRIQRRNIHTSGKRSDHKIDIDLYTCVHGWLDQKKEQRASLLVFDAQLVCTKGKGIFRRAYLAFEFDDQTPSKSPSNPDVLAYAPFVEMESSHEVTEDVSSRHQFEAGAGVSSIGEASAKYTRERETSYQNRYFDKGTANRFYDAPRDRYNGVWWNLNHSQNPHDLDGIRCNFRCAVLLKRSSDADFQGTFQLDVDAGSWYAVEKKFSHWRGVAEAETDDPINFHPSAPPQGEHQGIEPTRLGIWREDDKLRSLVKLPGLEPYSRAATGA